MVKTYHPVSELAVPSSADAVLVHYFQQSNQWYLSEIYKKSLKQLMSFDILCLQKENSRKKYEVYFFTSIELQ